MRKEWILVGLLFAALFVVYNKKVSSAPTVRQNPWDRTEVDRRPDEVRPPAVPPIPIVEVEIVDYPAVRQPDVSLGKVLSDIDSHMPAGHHFKDNDKMTWAHETTHGINNDVRNKYNGLRQGARVNAFYVLNSKAILVVEPKTTIRSTAGNVPASWKGQVWNTYMLNRSWDDTPLYIGDEWTAYINGTICGKDLGVTGIRYTCSMEFSCEFVGYALCLAYTVKKDCPQYDDKQFRAWVMYNCERLMNLYNNEAGASERMQTLRTSPDGEVIRQFARQYFGAAWCQRVLGF